MMDVSLSFNYFYGNFELFNTLNTYFSNYITTDDGDIVVDIYNIKKNIF